MMGNGDCEGSSLQLTEACFLFVLFVCVFHSLRNNIQRNAGSDEIDDAEVDTYLKPEIQRIFTEKVQELL